MQSAKVWTSPNMVSVLTTIEFHDLAAGRSLLSSYAPPPPDVPPANIQLMARTRDGSGLFCARTKTTFLQITIWVIRVASCRRRSRTLVGMMGTLAGQPVGTVGAIGCVLQPEKGPVASSSEQRKHGWMWRETVLSLRTAFGGLRTLPPMDSMPANKGGPGAIA